MNAKLVLPKHVTTNLKCNLCRGYLSVPPISTFEGKNSCGRCKPGWPRNVVYEELARFMVFPCTYCEQGLLWGQVEKHELECQQNVIFCPSRKRFKMSKYGEYHPDCQQLRVVCPFDCCYVMYEVKNIWIHFDRFHKDYVFSNEVEARKILKEEKVWNFNEDNHVCLIVFKQIPFLLFVHSDTISEESTGDIKSYDYYFSVFSLCQEECDMRYTVTISLSSDRENRFFTMKNQQIKPFNGKIHCINYLRNGMSKNKSFNFMTTKFDKLQKCIDMKLSYHVNIIEYQEQNVEKWNEDKVFINREGFGKTIECPICKEYMCAPIFNCNTGHTVCKECKEQLTVCPFCKAFVGDSRNFVLEDILETLQICCSNERKGCKFMGSVEEIKSHELRCVYN